MVLGIFELLIVVAVIAVPVCIVLVIAGRKSPPTHNPNLAPCPDCGHMVSMRADRCPQCGRPFPIKG